MARSILWWVVAAVAAWLLLPPSVASLRVALVMLTEDFGMPPVPSNDLLPLVGGVGVIVVMWLWTTPESARGRNSRRKRG